MGGAYIWPVPKMIDLEAHHYPRKFARNLAIYTAAIWMLNFQVNRYAQMCVVSILRSLQAIDDYAWRVP